MKKKRIKELKELIKQWDELAKNNPNNIHNLSTSERQDWIDELIEKEEEYMKKKFITLPEVVEVILIVLVILMVAKTLSWETWHP